MNIYLLILDELQFESDNNLRVGMSLCLAPDACKMYCSILQENKQLFCYSKYGLDFFSEGELLAKLAWELQWRKDQNDFRCKDVLR